MNAIYAYEIVGIVLQILVGYFYIKKNWLSLYKNEIFIAMTGIAIFIELVGLADQILYWQFGSRWLMCHRILYTAVYAAFYLLSLFLMVYVLALVEKMQILGEKWLHALLSLSFVFTLLLLSEPWSKIMFDIRIGEDSIVLQPCVLLAAYCALLLFFQLVGVVLLIKNYRKLRKRQRVLLVGLIVVYVLMLISHYRQDTLSILMPYFLTALTILFYMGIYNADQYMENISGCFSRNGFYYFAQEKLLYHKNIYCLSICLSNIDSISEYCLESEIRQIHARFGQYFRKKVGRHNVYHVHSSEYILVLQSEEKAQALAKELAEELPKTLRINDKNIAILYCIYQICAKDTGYDLQNFQRVLVALRKKATESTSDRQLMVYGGEIKEAMERELEGIAMISENTHSNNCPLECMPIISIPEDRVVDLEIDPRLRYADGERMSVYTMWRLVREMGILQDAQLIMWRQVLRFVMTYQLFEHGVKRVHVNMPAYCIVSAEICEEYLGIIEEYHVGPERFVLEISLDDGVPEEILKENISLLRSRGLHVQLDQFGVNACNLESVMNMPFDGVKVDASLTGDIRGGGSGQFMYLVRLLRSKQWVVCVDGMDYEKDYDALREAGIDYAQGESFSSFLSEEETREFLLERGGRLHDV